jgi:hypothetical protein
MLRILEMAWLAIALVSCAISGYQFFEEGWRSAGFMLVITSVAGVMYSIRRRQRINFEAVNKENAE